MPAALGTRRSTEHSSCVLQHLSGYDLYFALARGVPGTEALDMSKFFDTNYHYLVPELATTVTPKPDFSLLFDKVSTRPLPSPLHVSMLQHAFLFEVCTVFSCDGLHVPQGLDSLLASGADRGSCADGAHGGRR